MSIIGSFFRWLFEREGRKRTVLEWQQELQDSGAVVHGRIANGAGSEKDRTQARHVVGIERWAQSRLRVFLGNELVMDEYDSYRPEAESDMAALAAAFKATREETVELAGKLNAANIPAEQTVPHNDAGDMTVRGWLGYINIHALRESKSISRS